MIVWIICKGGRQLKKLLYGIALPFLLIHTAPLIAGNFTVTGVYDGETVRAKGYGVEIVVRLAGIQTPDLLQEEGPAHRLAMEAKSQLAEWTLERKVNIEGHGLDEFNRVIGVVYLNGVNINLQMIKGGYARVRKEGPLDSLYLLPYLKSEEIARRFGRGIWSVSGLHVQMFPNEK